MERPRELKEAKKKEAKEEEGEDEDNMEELCNWIFGQELAYEKGKVASILLE